MVVGKLKKGFKKMRAKVLEKQIKKLLNELDEVEKELDAYVEAHPEMLEDEEFAEEYRVLKKIIGEARSYGQKISRKKNVDFEEFVRFANYFGEIAEKLGKKYNPKIAEKAGKLKQVRIDNTAGTFDAGELDEEEIRRLAEELKKKSTE